MDRIYLPEQEMLPTIRMARLYDSVQDGRTRPTPERKADCFELGLYLQSSGSLIIDGVRREIAQGDVRLTRPGQQISSVPPYRCHTVFFYFGQPDVCHHNELLDALPDFFPAGLGQSTAFERLIKAFMTDAPGCIAQRNALLLEILCAYRNQLKAQRRCREPVRRCMDYMEAHFGERLSLETLGSLTGYSPLHMLRLFREDTGQSPHEYLSALRMNRAKQRLTESDTPVNELAEECGFSSCSYFQSMFKKQNGITPGQYRHAARVL